MINNITFPHLGLSFEISRSAFSVFGIPIYTYALLICTGIILGFVYAVTECKRRGIPDDDLLNMFLFGVPSAIVCARLYYVIFSWDTYRSDLLEIFNLRGGGLAIYGAVIGALAVVIIYCRIKKINLGEVLDILAIGLLIGQIIGRFGNFVNGEAFGSPTTLPWAMTVIRGGQAVAQEVHPTFIYEALLNLMGLVVLLIYKKHKRFSGEIFCGYMVWYGTVRFFVEGLRADSLYIGVFRVSQLLSLCLVAAGIILIIKFRKKHLTNPEV